MKNLPDQYELEYTGISPETQPHHPVIEGKQGHRGSNFHRIESKEINEFDPGEFINF